MNSYMLIKKAGFPGLQYVRVVLYPELLTFRTILQFFQSVVHPVLLAFRVVLKFFASCSTSLIAAFSGCTTIFFKL